MAAGGPFGLFQRADTGAVRFQDVTDGLSTTLMVGEKHIPPGRFGQQRDIDCSILAGFSQSSFRGAGPGFAIPLRITDVPTQPRFGSWHPGVCQFVFGDASVRAVPNAISTILLGNWPPAKAARRTRSFNAFGLGSSPPSV
jgi:hypothetical protein